MTHEEAVKRANEMRQGIEKDVDDFAAHFETAPLCKDLCIGDVDAGAT